MRFIWHATTHWLEIAERDGMHVDYDANPISGNEYAEAFRLAREATGGDYDPEDSESGIAVVVKPRECDSLLRRGDLVLTTGPGGDVAFVRPTEDNEDSQRRQHRAAHQASTTAQREREAGRLEDERFEGE